MRFKRLALILMALMVALILAGCRATLNRVAPGSASSGSVVTLKGLWFDDEAGDARVYFGETEATVVLWSKREIKVKVPEGSGTCGVYVEKEGSITKEADFTYLEEEYKEIASKLIEPSATAQTADAEGISVTIPPGAIGTSTKLTVSSVENAPGNDDDLYLDGDVLSVRMEGISRFDDLLMLELDIEKGMEDSEYIAAAYWDGESAEWVRAPSYYDRTKGTVRVYTDHLTNWRLLALKKIYDIHETDHFLIAYNKKDKTDLPGQTSSKSAEEMAQKIGDALDDAYSKYTSAVGSANSPNYMLTELAVTAATLNPSTWFSDNKEIIDTRLIVRMSSSYNKYGAEYSWTTEQLIIPTKYKDDQELRTTAAHELFHAFQNTRLTVLQMGSARWLMEATAEYASYYVGNSYTIDRLHTYTRMDKNLEYFENRGGGHEYGMSAYIRYLTGNGVSFGSMWNAIVAGRSDAAEAFDSYVKSATGESNHTNYRKFWQNVLTNKSMPEFGITDIGVRAKSIAAGTTLKASLNVKNDWAMSALLTSPRKFNSDGTRTLIIEADGDLPSTALVEAFRVDGFDKKAFSHERTDGGSSALGILGPLYPFIAVDFVEGMGQAVYVTCFSGESGSIGIKISDISLKLNPDGLDDAEPNKMYKFSAVATNIPTSIMDISVKWELNDGTFLKYDEFANKRGRISDKLTYEFEQDNLQDITVTFEDINSGRKITTGRIKVSDTQVINIDYEPSPPMAGEEVSFSADGQKDWYYSWNTGSGAAVSGQGMDETTRTYGEAGRHQVTVKAYSDSAMTKSVGFGSVVIEVMEKEAEATPEPEPEPTEQPQQPTEERTRWLAFDRDEYLPGEWINYEIKTNSAGSSTYESLNYYKWSAKPADEETMKRYTELMGKTEVYTNKSGSPGYYSPEVPGKYEVTGVFVQDPDVTVTGTFVVKDGTGGIWRRVAYTYPKTEQYDTTTTSNDDIRITTRTVGETTKLSHTITSTTSYPDGKTTVRRYEMKWSELPETMVPGEVIALSFSSTYEGESGSAGRSGLAVFYNERGNESGIKSESSYAGWDSGLDTVVVEFEVPAYGTFGNAAKKLDMISGTGLYTEDDAMFIPENYIFRVIAAYVYEEDGRTY